MPSGSNASRRSRHQLRGDEIPTAAAGGKRIMKRVKRLAERSVEGGGNEKKRFVGVRQRPSGRWVAEIKDTTQKIRLWLGTFDSAEEGAKAYDSAARALRGANTRTNFVATIASSSCESAVPTKTARLIRQRQTTPAAAVSATPACELRHEPNHAMSRPHLGQGHWAALSQEADTISQSTITCESHSHDADVNPCLGDSAPDHPRQLTSNDGASSPVASSPAASSPATDSEMMLRDASGGHESERPSQDSFPCAINRADEEASSFVDDNEVMPDTTAIQNHDSNGTRTAAAADVALGKDDTELDDDVAGSDHFEDLLDHRLDMIPWPEDVLMEGLDLSCCETTSSTVGVYPAFEFSTEAMDRDSEQYLSDDSSDFLLRLQPQQQMSQHNSNEFQNPCELSRPAVIVGPDDDHHPSPDGASEECPGQGDQALWVDLPPLCMVA